MIIYYNSLTRKTTQLEFHFTLYSSNIIHWFFLRQNKFHKLYEKMLYYAVCHFETTESPRIKWGGKFNQPSKTHLRLHFYMFYTFILAFAASWTAKSYNFMLCLKHANVLLPLLLNVLYPVVSLLLWVR